MKNNISLRAALMSLLLCFGLVAMAQMTVTGTVTDATTGEPVIGASVLEVEIGRASCRERV